MPPGTRTVVAKFPKFETGAHKEIKYGPRFCDSRQLVSDRKSDRESDEHPIFMQIGQIIGREVVRVDGH
jgi:hypothetical protein